MKRGSFNLNMNREYRQYTQHSKEREAEMSSHSHLGNQLEGCEARVEEVVSVLRHLNSGQPVLNRTEGSEVWDGPVQQRLRRSGGGEGERGRRKMREREQRETVQFL
ncbi:hypothetical protein DNTS_022955 [Danionella cerebrum]|uniref:Uncharacterized protein n=1 Tax=Danionella cerebrum TaxID=2873325 RepID=A0A553Q2V2_9TELE|nr:hypothetical protein DNTS_022955 [Danionella translucida]